jgi:hypothetical protein
LWERMMGFPKGSSITLSFGRRPRELASRRRNMDGENLGRLRLRFLSKR